MSGTPGATRLESVTAGGADATDSGVTVRAGEEVDDILVTLTSTPARLAGGVLGDEARAGDCSVSLSSRDERHWSFPATRYISVANTTNGSFEVVGLPRGTYYAAAVYGMEKGREHDPGYLRYLIKSSTTTVMTIKEGQNQTSLSQCTR